MEYVLSPEQRGILRALVRAQDRDPASGLYFVLGGAYEHVDEAIAAAEGFCIAHRTPPLTAFHDYEAMVERDRKHERIEAEFLDRHRLPEKQEPEQLDRIKEMARKLAWKADDSGPG
jgi:hypothetical protein